MRHRTVFASVVICLLASLGLSSQALAVTNSDCDGTPYTDEFALNEFSMDSPLSHKAGEVGGISVGVLACGSYFTDTGGDYPALSHVKIHYPPGARTTNTSTVPVGSYVGETEVDLLTHRNGFPEELKNVNSPMFVDDLSVCQSASNDLIGVHTFDEIVACYKVKNDLVGKSWNWVALDGAGGSTFTVGPMYALGWYLNVEFTHMQTDICGYFGTVNPPADERSCGTSDGVNVQRNGKVSASFPKLKCDANGTYSATGIRRDGQATRSVSSCVPWVDSGVYPRLGPHGPSRDLPSPGRGLPKQPLPHRVAR